MTHSHGRSLRAHGYYTVRHWHRPVCLHSNRRPYTKSHLPVEQVITDVGEISLCTDYGRDYGREHIHPLFATNNMNKSKPETRSRCGTETCNLFSHKVHATNNTPPTRSGGHTVHTTGKPSPRTRYNIIKHTHAPKTHTPTRRYHHAEATNTRTPPSLHPKSRAQRRTTSNFKVAPPGIVGGWPRSPYA